MNRKKETHLELLAKVKRPNGILGTHFMVWTGDNGIVPPVLSCPYLNSPLQLSHDFCQRKKAQRLSLYTIKNERVERV